MRRIHVPAALILLTLAIPAQAGPTVAVPAYYPTIQQAIDAILPGSTVIVAPGTYHENIDFHGKAIHVVSSGGPAVTIIDGSQASSVVTFRTGEGNGAILEGFTITNGAGQPPSSSLGGGVYCFGASPTLKSNIIHGNSAGSGGGVACLGSSDPILINNMIYDNQATLGGGLYCEGASDPVLTNNTFTGNSAGAAGGALYCADVCGPTVTNTILWNDSAPNGPEILALFPGLTVVNHSDIQGGWNGTGNINADPLFTDSMNRDLHIAKKSPCVNTGDRKAPAIPVEDFEGDTRTAFGEAIVGTPDMGADEMFFCAAEFTITPYAGSYSTIHGYIGSGPPGSAWVLFVGVMTLPYPWPNPYGYWYLAPPVVVARGVFPPAGCLSASHTFGDLSYLTQPATVYFQAGTESCMSLTGLCSLTVHP